MSAILDIFAILRCLIGLLLAKLLYFLVDEVINFDISDLTLKSDKNWLKNMSKNMLNMIILKTLPSYSK